MYFIVALSMIVFSVMAVTTRKILRAATYLLFTLFAAAVVYFMLDYEFLGAVQIAVYAGGYEPPRRQLGAPDFKVARARCYCLCSYTRCSRLCTREPLLCGFRL